MISFWAASASGSANVASVTNVSKSGARRSNGAVLDEGILIALCNSFLESTKTTTLSSTDISQKQSCEEQPLL
jgi:hypothetical protein